MESKEARLKREKMEEKWDMNRKVKKISRKVEIIREANE